MAQTFQIVRGATFPSIVVKCEERNEDGDWEAILGLSGATVKFKMTTPDGRVLIDDKAGAVHDAVKALIRYDWGTGDTDQIHQLYPAKFHVTLTSGKVLYVPVRERDELFVEIVKDV